MEPSILISIKKLLGIEVDATEFDMEIIIQINSAFSVLAQLGVTPSIPIVVEDDQATWAQFIEGVTDIDMVRAYVYLKVRLAFDPPATSFGITAIENQIAEYAWRLNTRIEEIIWVDPTVIPTA